MQIHNTVNSSTITDSEAAADLQWVSGSRLQCRAVPQFSPQLQAATRFADTHTQTWWICWECGQDIALWFLITVCYTNTLTNSNWLLWYYDTVSTTTTTFAKRACRCSAVATWNSLPKLSLMTLITVCKSELKTFLFSQTFSLSSFHQHTARHQRLWSQDFMALCSTFTDGTGAGDGIHLYTYTSPMVNTN